MIRETITFKFADEAQQLRFHDRLNTHCRCEEREDASEEIMALRLALTQLSNEVLGSLPLVEPLARREMGNTNYSLMMQRAEEARALLGKSG